MSRFLFNPLGTLGDITPYIAIAQVLQKRGHAAVIATQARYRPLIEQANVGFFPVVSDSYKRQMPSHRQMISKGFNSRFGIYYLIQLMINNVKPVYEQLREPACHADMVVSHPLGLALPLIAEKYRIPWVSSVLSPMNLMSCYDPPVLPAFSGLYQLQTLGILPYRFAFSMVKQIIGRWEKPLAAFRKEIGLPATDKLALFEGKFSPLLNLALFDEVLATAQPDWPVNTKICGYPVSSDDVADTSHIQELRAFLAEGEAPIVFSMGASTAYVAKQLWRIATESVEALQKRAVFLTGIENSTVSGTDKIKVFPFLPYPEVFPHASVIVHQAGLGTLTQALRAGYPQLAIPAAFDQLDNAYRLKRMGVADAISFRRLETKKMTEKLDSLLNDSSYADNARITAGKMPNADGAEVAANELIQQIGMRL